MVVGLVVNLHLLQRKKQSPCPEILLDQVTLFSHSVGPLVKSQSCLMSHMRDI